MFCFTPKGAVIRLPKEASPVDFAYAVHTEIGDDLLYRCRINGKESPLEARLMNGDSVEIVRSKKYLLHIIGYHMLRQVRQELQLEILAGQVTG